MAAVEVEELQGRGLQTAKDLFSGAVGGIAQVLIGQPFDIVKVRLQTTSRYSGAVHAAASIYRNEGALAFYKGTLTPLLGIGACVSIQFGAFHAARRWLGASARGGVLAAVYRGTAVTVCREAAAYGAWFAAFEYLVSRDAARNAVHRRDVPAWKIALYGGLAAKALWLASYPFDVVKSKMQTDGFGPGQKYPSMRACFAATWRADGLAGFWRGIWPTLFRAMPVSAGTFAVVEMTMRAIG
ncbi:mitochondrial carrier protein (Ymc1) [Metarhizium album ARSEF 1941]|uniref:Mitochondrial carrier protein (Ymc1) n=1 Tax=Metarhizium album (strain ARSEF 1941) TaxID=1081103 RepID=A0A0B2WXK0_METAS|nr:mitochondrial carrier protein (Ymc1) [Metarhizium album ARSEF 1941]KHO01017.1 mitochondrial carrier protein (Ymc1) [Metarhizium album ARSEF 1941]